ncbi:acyl-CoA dehydrogenase family protein [uncultured Thermomonospora sp.]|uniref:acyl-CoA dehydrogenase family protein n=1 Tax=uncultured Thermomonospora sp. TaxID=671175 RepID=UPI00259B9524|nr:acyl-CoA dehydrogenase family protein [uncultured Thermomonospora sp.]
MTHDISPDEVRASLRAFFGDPPGIAEARRLRDAGGGADDDLARAGFDERRWAAIAEQIGLTAMAAPEDRGGLELGVAHLVAAAEECGAALYPGPARAALLVGWSLRALPSSGLPQELEERIERFLTGRAVPALAAAGEDAPAPTLTAGRLHGTAARVTHGRVADLVLCPVRTDQGPAMALAAIPPQAARSALATVDLTTPRADITVDGAPAVPVTAPGDRADLERHRTVAWLLAAAEQVGGAEGCLAAMVSYAAVREQFGRPIGSYQAIQHRCADTAIDATAARALVAAGANACDGGDRENAHRLALLARAEAAECFLAAAGGLIQVSGGVGFTWEHDAHLYFRRARATAVAEGTPEQFRHRAVEAGCLELLTAPIS